MEIETLEKYTIKKGWTDIKSSLKKIDRSVLDEMFEDESIEEIAEFILEDFEFCLESSKDDIFTIMFFEKLIRNENSSIFSAYESDVESFFVFVYKKEDYYSYYIPKEIREIIRRILGF